MKTILKKVLLVALVAIFFIIQFDLKVDAATTEPNWYGGAYDSSVNIFSQSGYYGQCTWYAWGRAYELTGIQLSGCTGPGSDWYSQAQSAGYTVSSTPRANSIACWRYGEGYGHVAFVESVSGENISITEANYNNNRWDWMDFETGIGNYDGRSTINPYSRNGFQGYIYVGEDPDSTPPVILDAYVSIYDMQTGCFRVEAKVSDNIGVTSVKFPTWTQNNGQDDIIWHDGVYNSTKDLWEYVVDIKDHKNETGLYNVHAYVYDAAGNYSMKELNNLVIGNTPVNLGDFTGRIVEKSDSNKVVGISGKSASSKSVIQNKNLLDSTQLWKFVRDSSGKFYRIQNVSTGLWLHVAEALNDNGTEFIICNKQETDAQRFFVMTYNGGYRIVPKCSEDMKAFDFGGGSNRLHLWDAVNMNYDLQTVKFEKAATSLTINRTTASVNVRKTVSLSATISPTDAATKSITWKSNNTSVATVSSSGVVTGKSVGTAIITATTNDGTNLSKKCTVTVKSDMSFTDVNSSDWYYNAVKYCYDNKIILGTTSTTFEPNTKLTRGMLVTILHRMEGHPYVAGTSKFPDVQDTKAYYYVAVKWATKNKIVSGYSNGKFGPNDSITREQLAVILNQYCRYKGKYKTQNGSLSRFKDGNKVSDFAKFGMQWATGAGVVTGSGGYINPQGNATRAEVASMLYKYHLNIK